jgi:uncharacterized YigZ family protein
MANYCIPAKPSQIEIEIKRSRFLGFAAHTSGTQAAKAFIQSLKDAYPDARHHCYGFMAGAPWDSNQYGFSDDNEPNGTAGMPIFSHLKHNNIGEITIVIVRYFGGTKLGTGGLARAYSDAAKEALNQLILKNFVEMETVNFSIEFAQEAQIRKIIEDAGGQIMQVHYTNNVNLQASIPKDVTLPLPYSVEPSRSTI